MKIMLTTVISGGQTGIDELALQLAKQYGIETGGWMPPDFLTEEGPKPEFEAIYGMKALDSGLWAKRTRYNVRDSDGTAIFGNVLSGGTASTINFCKKYKKPYCINPNDQELTDFVVSQHIKVLNVAGNKASILSQEHYQSAYESLSQLFQQTNK